MKQEIQTNTIAVLTNFVLTSAACYLFRSEVMFITRRDAPLFTKFQKIDVPACYYVYAMQFFMS